MSGGLVLVTGDGPEHRYVVNRICATHDVAAILMADPPPRRNWRKVLRRSPAAFVDKTLWRLFLRLVRDDRAREAALREVLGSDCERFVEAEKILRVGRPREGRLARASTDLAPDVIAVYGTGIIPDEVLRQARLAALNMHTGISPRYRGAGCAFWPIHENEPEWVGATVHECTSLVDGGRIFFTGRAELRRGDNLHHIFARAVRVGTEGYVRVIGEALAGHAEGAPQDLAAGREYPGALRGLASELRARARLRRLRRDWPSEGM